MIFRWVFHRPIIPKQKSAISILWMAHFYQFSGQAARIYFFFTLPNVTDATNGYLRSNCHKLMSANTLKKNNDHTGKDCPKMFLPQVINGVKLDHAWLAFKDKLPITPFETPVEYSSTLELNKWDKILLVLRQIWQAILKM